MSSISEPQTLMMEHSTAYSSMRFWISREAPSGVRVHIGQRGVDHAERCDRPAIRRRKCRRRISASFSWIRPKSAIDLAERLALLGVLDGVLQTVARAADAGRAQLEAADVQNVERDLVALADFAEQVLHRHLAVGQDQRAGGGARGCRACVLRRRPRSRACRARR